MKPSRASRPIVACALTLLPVLAQGQKFVNENPRIGGGCTGFTHLVRFALLPRSASGGAPGIQVRGYPTVVEVDSTSSAAKAGVAVGDSLVSVNGVSVINEPKALALPAGATMKLTVKRGDKLLDFVFRMGERQLVTTLAYDSTTSNAPRTKCVASGSK